MWWFIKARAGVCVSISRTLTRKPQGMIVAILFCLINNEVIFQVKKFFADRTGHGQGGRHPSLALTQYTVRSHSYNRVGGRAGAIEWNLFSCESFSMCVKPDARPRRNRPLPCPGPPSTTPMERSSIRLPSDCLNQPPSAFLLLR